MKPFFTAILKPRVWVAQVMILGLVILLVFLEASDKLAPVKEALDAQALSFNIGETRLSPYVIAKGLLTIIVLIWIVGIVSEFGEKRISNLKSFSRSSKVLVTKAFQIAIYALGFVLSLDIIGINLTAFTVVGGAIGIGIGFGLQKITSNFISGIILLFEKSVESDDVVELSDGTFGYVRQTRARYMLVETPDGKEIMIPNEDFITNRVVNWTYSNTRGRIDINVGVSYSSDIEKARELMLEAALEHSRCISDPPPVCYLREFADSSVNFALFFWVEDVTLGRYEPQSDVMRSIWKKFEEHGIEIPFPQRDVHIKSGQT